MDKCITIDYEDFKDLLEKQSLYTCFKNDLDFLIDDSKLDYYKKDLEMRSSVNEFAKKYCTEHYESKLACLKYEKEREEENGD